MEFGASFTPGGVDFRARAGLVVFSVSGAPPAENPTGRNAPVVLFDYEI